MKKILIMLLLTFACTIHEAADWESRPISDSSGARKAGEAVGNVINTLGENGGFQGPGVMRNAIRNIFRLQQDDGELGAQTASNAKVDLIGFVMGALFLFVVAIFIKCCFCKK
eukprot:405771_1